MTGKRRDAINLKMDPLLFCYVTVWDIIKYLKLDFEEKMVEDEILKLEHRLEERRAQRSVLILVKAKKNEKWKSKKIGKETNQKK